MLNFSFSRNGRVTDLYSSAVSSIRCISCDVYFPICFSVAGCITVTLRPEKQHLLAFPMININKFHNLQLGNQLEQNR